MTPHRLCLLMAVSTTLALLTNGADARLAGNRLAGNRLAGNRLAANRLAGNSLTSTSLDATQAAAELLGTAEGRDLYSYIISCALPSDASIQAMVEGVADTAPPATVYTCTSGTCVFPGSLGLAEYWLTRRLDSKGQRWISACLLARVNNHDTAESISLRGVAPSLTVGEDEAALYDVEEGAFFGNIFVDPDAPLDMNACRGEGQASGEFGGLVLRDCTEPDPLNPGYTMCGFKYAGDCADYTPASPDPYACRNFDPEDGTYGECHAADANAAPSIVGSRPYREVITTWVTSE
jgi:hypothetical protein